MKAYYNEHDRKAAAWLRELIKQGHIAQGDVDERSIEDVLPSELAGYTQCHFFAGIGVWSAALRGAGWPDDRPVWTGSCPCQPFSAAGKRGGTDDERHLWPAFYWLIQQCKPVVIFGEQVASKDGITWFNDVQSDLEAENYVVGGFDIPAAGFGAPHIRQRLFFVADANSNGEKWTGREKLIVDAGREAGILADAASQRYDGRRAIETSGRKGESERSCNAGKLGNTESNGWIGRQDDGNGWRRQCSSGQAGQIDGMGDASSQRLQERVSDGRIQSTAMGSSEGQAALSRGATNGFWADAEWLYCRDGKYRPTKPGVFPLAHGVANRVVKLRGCGNAIVKAVAEEFIKAYLDQEQTHIEELG